MKEGRTLRGRKRSERMEKGMRREMGNAKKWKEDEGRKEEKKDGRMG